MISEARRHAPQFWPADCHPFRRVFRAGLCRYCYQARPAGPIGVVALARAEQRAAGALPNACPKCRAGPPAWRTQAAYGWCFICGADRFVTVDGVPTAGS